MVFHAPKICFCLWIRKVILLMFWSLDMCNTYCRRSSHQDAQEATGLPAYLINFHYTYYAFSMPYIYIYIYSFSLSLSARHPKPTAVHPQLEAQPKPTCRSAVTSELCAARAVHVLASDTNALQKQQQQQLPHTETERNTRQLQCIHHIYDTLSISAWPFCHCEAGGQQTVWHANATGLATCRQRMPQVAHTGSSIWMSTSMPTRSTQRHRRTWGW